MRHWLTLAGILLTWAPGAQARPLELSLTWVVPPACPSADSLRRQIEGFLTSGRGPHLEVIGKVAESKQGDFALTLRLRTPLGQSQRTLHHGDCSKLTEAAALLIALAVDPDHVRSPGATRPSPPTATRKPPTGEPPSAEAATPFPVAWSLGLYGILGGGVLPGTSGGSAFELEATLNHQWRLALMGKYWTPSRQDLALGHADYAYGAGSLRGCWLLPGTWELGACLGPELGPLVGSGGGLAQNRQATALWAALAFDLRLAVELTPWLSLGLGGELLASLTRPRFGVDELGEIYRPGPLGYGGRLGLVFRFPSEG